MTQAARQDRRRERLESVQTALAGFASQPLRQAALSFWAALGYGSPRTAELGFADLLENAPQEGRGNLAGKLKALEPEVSGFELLFQLTTEDVRAAGQPMLMAGQYDQTNIESYLFVAVRLNSDAQPARNVLADMARTLNRAFRQPVLTLFITGQGPQTRLSLTAVQRRVNKREADKDVLGKVTLVYDVDTAGPRRSLEVLTDLHLDELLVSRDIRHFAQLESAWAAQFAVEALNKRFYLELSNWFYWATAHPGVSFPDERGGKLSDKERTELRQRHLIRLITRLMFVWFLREKELVPERLFLEKNLKTLLKDFDPRSKDNSDFYQAILQNLFFATLNTEMGENRKFLGQTKSGYNPEHGVSQVYRYPELFKDETQALAAFATVPFLNGGLFECLDAAKDSTAGTSERRIDGFSSKPEKRAHIPNEIFFLADERPAPELNAVYGTKNKKYGVRGLVSLLSAYKFTTTENTPVEEEVALDPELLGKVFENLLAAVTEDTQDTARKKTGSFYTPRYVVDDMTDDALLTYFGRAMGEGGDMHERLSALLSYSDEAPDWSDAERRQLVKAVDELDILDPACGSGAFPMGALQKLVHVLGRIDRENELWLEQQREPLRQQVDRLKADQNLAGQISEVSVRDKAISDLEARIIEIEKAFDKDYSNHDYARKLFLIENCIYGVDIQPIAVQISKLRCFISLVVDQHTNDNPHDNRGILPLPNLESQFVAANTLGKVGQDDQQSLAESTPEVKKLRAELAAVRHEHFLARKHRAKKELRKKDKAIREKLAHELTHFPGTSKDDAQKLADFDPYDQNATAGFFDAKWMFNLDGGKFDIVIGNPPYGSKIDKKQLEKQYVLQDQWDSYLVFLERAFELCKDNGVIVFIIPSTWLINLNQKAMRKYVFARKSINSVKFYSKRIFDAVVDTYIFSISNKLPDEESSIKLLKYSDDNIIDIWHNQQINYKYNSVDSINVFAKPQIHQIASNIIQGKRILDEICAIVVGVKPYQVGKGKPAQTRDVVKDRIFDANVRIDDSYLPIIRGGDFNRYTSPSNKKWIKYGPHLAEPRQLSNFTSKEKIVVRQTGDSIIATLDTEQFICMNNIHTINLRNNLVSLRYILGLLNSKVMTFYFRYMNPEEGEVLAEVKRDHVGKLPIALAKGNVEKLVINLVDALLFLAAQPQTPSLALSVAYFERVLDALVYELYLPTELHSLGYEPFAVISAHAWPELSGDAAQDLAALDAVFTAWYDPQHPIRQLTYYLDSVPAVRIIEGKEETGAAGSGADA